MWGGRKTGRGKRGAESRYGGGGGERERDEECCGAGQGECYWDSDVFLMVRLRAEPGRGTQSGW